MTELKACPFCGGEAMCGIIPSALGMMRPEPRWRACCNTTLYCCAGPEAKTREDAIAAWNARAPAAQQKEAR